jgi:hypothetical protein
MPKSAYNSHYYYFVKEFDDNSLNNLVNSKRYVRIDDIKNDYDISRTNIYYKITGKKDVKKYKNLVILKEKVPIFTKTLIEY